ncbi:DUF500-domain-containing protein [Microthyrium microscopicum]|uniref:DUF500-domain-containing protein n=1 Tax=Microthyrium microscopicum TaxID=703497 RepID=A0A6A6UCW9_9PEZI|nr:DUF500-domain-containing protein [Microthyrium microscopicum]
MPLGINNPLPFSSMKSECKKAAKILTSFVDPNQALGQDKIIPPDILARAKGLAILSVVKIGFLGSGRVGSGLVIARLPDGTWSAPSAIGTGGAGFGGQIGLEFTDFVFILNSNDAVKTFSQAGSVTLGGNVGIAAGPVGRSAEAAGAASMKGVSGVFAYSRTKGLFAGVSLEGSVIIERKDANAKLYNRTVSAASLLGGSIPAPTEADALLHVLNSRTFAGVAATTADAVYNEEPVYGDEHEDVSWRDGRSPTSSKPNRSATWQDDLYDRDAPSEHGGGGINRSYTQANESANRSFIPAKRAPPPIAPKPKFGQKGAAADQAVAKFTFDGEQDGDLSFKKGDIVTILKRTDNETDWWTGRIGGREGIFPSNYVDVI